MSTINLGGRGRQSLRVARSRCFVFFLAAISTSATSFTAWADADDKAVDLGEITVRASAFGRPADDLVQPVDVLTGSQLERKRKTTLGETLEGELGVATSDFGPGVGRPIIRGQAGPRVQVLENGIGSMDLSSASDDHAVTIDPSDAQQVEIIKGPATLIYGSGASGGVVNVVNNRLAEKYDDGLHAKADASYAGNGNDRNSSANLDYGVGSTMFHADGSERRALGDFKIPGNTQPDGGGTQGFIPNSFVRTQSAGIGATNFSDWGNVGLAGSLYNNRYGVPGDVGTTKFLNMYQKRLDLSGKLLAPAPWLESLRARVGLNSYEHQELGDPDLSAPGTTFLNRQHEIRVEGTHAPMGGWHGLLGVQVIDRNASAIGTEVLLPETLTQTQGLYVVEEHPLGAAKIELGARVEKQSNRPQPGCSNPKGCIDRDHTPVSVSAGAIYPLDAHHHVHFNASRAQRAPSAEELYTFGGHDATGSFERGEPGLKTETANDLEIGFDRHGERLGWQANLFYNKLSNYIFLQPANNRTNADGSAADPAAVAGFGPDDPDRVDGEGVLDPAGDLLLVDVRQANAKLYGAEAQITYLLVQDPFRLSSRVFGDMVRGKLDSGPNLPRITPARYGAELDAGYDNFTGTVTLTRVAKQSQVAPVESPTAGYTLLSADLGYTMHFGELAPTLYLRGRNLLDQEARRHTSFLKDVNPLPGRTFIVGARVEFN